MLQDVEAPMVNYVVNRVNVLVSAAIHKVEDEVDNPKGNLVPEESVFALVNLSIKEDLNFI